MKRLFYPFLLVGLLVGIVYASNAQAIPNNGFETWTTRGTIEAPVNWLTTDDFLPLVLTNFARTNTGTVTKSADAHSSPFAAKLTNVVLNNLGYSGALYLGSRFDVNLLGGVAYTARPAQMQFYYKYSGPASDSAVAEVILTRTTATGPQIVGIGAMLLAPATGYTQMTVPITYRSSALPDSVRLYFDSCVARRITIGATLLIDDITLNSTALAVRADASLQEQLTVSPNPSPTGRFSVGSPTQPDLAAAPLTVFDVTGRAVLRQPALAPPASGRELDLSSLPGGIYTLRLDSKQGALVRQLVVK